MPPARDLSILDDLRVRIARVEGEGRPQRGALPFGVAALDQHLPSGGLALGALHEAFGAGPELSHSATAVLFAAGVLARLQGPVFWCLQRRDLFAPALAGAGLHPDRVLYVEAGDEAAVLAVAEEALRHPGLAGVVVEAVRLGLTPSRRLQHAAEASGALGLVLRRWRRVDVAPSEGTAATTRWRVTALPSSPPVHAGPGVGRPRWRLELVRCRGGQAPAGWIVEAPDGQGRMRLATDMADRSASPPVRRAAG